jgi:NAD(P)-dependent dehydrogenase (short-subunit alcohol dehydrogenase family)
MAQPPQPEVASQRRVALVFGASRGIGAACAAELARIGLVVHGTWRTEGPNASALRERLHGRAHACDLAIPGQAEAVVSRVAALEGRLDVVVVAAGDYLSGPLASHTSAQIGAQLEAQVVGPARVFEAARPHLRASRGAAVLFGVAGLEGLRGRRNSAAYCAAKSALLVLVRSWALEEARHGLRVNMVSPGVVPHEHADRETLDPAVQAKVPLEGATTPADLANAVRWLCSDDARHITGVDLPVAGGFQL